MTNPQTAIGCAYRAADSERPLVKRAIRIDMVVRAATIQHIPYGAYLPEPLLCVLLKRPDAADNLKDLSFVGAGQALESRRLVENGRGRGVLTDNMTFIPDGLVTETSAWQVGKNCGRRDISSIKQKWVLQALRGLRQSHAHPKKWADQVYAALPFSCSQVTDATMPIMHIFGVYDPISRMFAEHGRFSAKVFDRVLANYALPLSAGQQNTVGTSMTRLLQLGMPRAQVDQIVWAAAAAGRAISAELLRAY